MERNFVSSVLALALIPQLLISADDMKQSIGVRGSFVIAAICRDGIVVTTDSRANIFDTTDPRQRPLAYFDLRYDPKGLSGWRQRYCRNGAGSDLERFLLCNRGASWSNISEALFGPTTTARFR
jgi:hypothetical protein